MRQRIDYGIDLGTTNSALARMEGGEPKILKSDDTQSDTTPSCVAFTKAKNVHVGAHAQNLVQEEASRAFRRRAQGSLQTPNAFAEFKRTMGTDRLYHSDHMADDFASEALSAHVLRKLRSYVRDEPVDTAVITVPAMFRQNQLDATQRAAEMAGFSYVELLQEPIAASIAYGIQAGAIDGHWLVFDFGGGTFDAALMRVEEGVMRVVDTEGDNHLGGKNLDQAIVEELLLPALEADSHLALTQTLADPERRRLLAGALKRHAERAKIQLSTRESVLIEIEDLGDDDEGEEIIAEINLVLTDWERVARPTFQRSIDLCRALLARNGLSGESLRTLIPVGGPTLSQTLRRMLREQLTERLDTRVDPMTAVARGAAIFASTRQVPRAMQRRDTSKAQLTLRHPDSTVETEVTVGVRVDREMSTGVLPGALSIELVRADRGWTSGRLALEDDVAVLTAALEPGVQNRFEVTLTDSQGNSLDAEPAEFSILQGLRIAHATLPYHIGVDVVDLASGQQGVYPIAGLEKNRSLPARGKGTYRTAKTIRAGETDDRICIEFVEMAYEAIGSKASLNQPLGSITLTGKDLTTTLPEGTAVEITLKVDASRRITATVFFPVLDEQIDRAMEPNLQSEDHNRLRADLTEARSVVARVRDIASPDTLIRLEVEFDALEKLMVADGADLDRLLEVRERLRSAMVELDASDRSADWLHAEKRLEAAMASLTVTVRRLQSTAVQPVIDEFHQRIAALRTLKDPRIARAMTDEIRAHVFTLVREDIGLWASYIAGFERDFDSRAWTDPTEARTLLDEALKRMAGKPDRAELERVVIAMFALLPREDRLSARQVSDEVLRQ